MPFIVAEYEYIVITPIVKTYDDTLEYLNPDVLNLTWILINIIASLQGGRKKENTN